MLTITMKIPRKQNDYIYYTGDANSYLNMPIIIGGKSAGTIMKILSSTDEYIEVEGVLFKAGVNYFVEPYLYPCDIEIR